MPSPLQSTNLSLSRGLTVGQNNLVDDINPWCFPCSDGHMPQNFLHDNLQQKVAKQCSQGATSDHGGYAYASLQNENVVPTTKMKGMPLEQETNISPNHMLFSLMEEEEVVFSNDASPSETMQVQSNYNTCSKKRFMGEPVVPQLVNSQPKSAFD